MASLTIPGIERVHPRESWEQPGWEIDGAIHGKGISSSRPYRAPRASLGDIRFGMAHYTGSDDLIDGDPGEFEGGLPLYLAAIQRSYLNSHGFSIGYWWAVDWLGGAWQIRGPEYRAAANNGDKGEWSQINLNRFTCPILFLVDGADRLTEAAARTGRAIYREMQRLTIAAGGQPWEQTSPKPHHETDYTACPGWGISTDISEGLLDMNFQETPPPSPTPVPDWPRRISQRATVAAGKVLRVPRPALLPADAQFMSVGIHVKADGPGWITSRPSDEGWSADVSHGNFQAGGWQTVTPMVQVGADGFRLGIGSGGGIGDATEVEVIVDGYWFT